jgi:hypothetical protein
MLTFSSPLTIFVSEGEISNAADDCGSGVDDLGLRCQSAKESQMYSSSS